MTQFDTNINSLVSQLQAQQAPQQPGVGGSLLQALPLALSQFGTPGTSDIIQRQQFSRERNTALKTELLKQKLATLVGLRQEERKEEEFQFEKSRRPALVEADAARLRKAITDERFTEQRFNEFVANADIRTSQALATLASTEGGNELNDLQMAVVKQKLEGLDKQESLNLMQDELVRKMVESGQMTEEQSLAFMMGVPFETIFTQGQINQRALLKANKDTGFATAIDTIKENDPFIAGLAANKDTRDTANQLAVEFAELEISDLNDIQVRAAKEVSEVQFGFNEFQESLGEDIEDLYITNSKTGVQQFKTKELEIDFVLRVIEKIEPRNLMKMQRLGELDQFLIQQVVPLTPKLAPKKKNGQVDLNALKQLIRAEFLSKDKGFKGSLELIQGSAEQAVSEAKRKEQLLQDSFTLPLIEP